MIFIVAYLPKHKDWGPADFMECEHCDRESYFVLSERWMEAQLFFLPIYRHQRMYFQECPHCGKAVNIAEEDWPYYKSLASLQNQFIAGSLTESEFEAKKEALKKP
jgi:hypothetical protein